MVIKLIKFESSDFLEGKKNIENYIFFFSKKSEDSKNLYFKFFPLTTIF